MTSNIHRNSRGGMPSEVNSSKTMDQRREELSEKHHRFVLNEEHSIKRTDGKKSDPLGLEKRYVRPKNRFAGKAQPLASGYRKYQTILCCIVFLTLGIAFILAGCMRYSASMPMVIALGVFLGIALSSLLLLGLSSLFRHYVVKRRALAVTNQPLLPESYTADYHMQQAMKAAEEAVGYIHVSSGNINPKITKQTLEKMREGIISTRKSLDIRMKECENTVIFKSPFLVETLKVLTKLEACNTQDLIGVAAESAATVAVTTSELGIQAHAFINASMQELDTEKNLEGDPEKNEEIALSPLMQKCEKGLVDALSEAYHSYHEYQHSTEELMYLGIYLNKKHLF